MLNGAWHEFQGAARPAPAIPGLEQGNPAVPNRPAPPAGQAPAGGVTGGSGAIPGPATLRTAKEIRDNIRSQIQDATRRGGDPQIIIPPDFNFRNAVPQGAVNISVAFFVMVAFVIVGLPIARAFGRRMDRRSDALASGAGNIGPQIEQLQQSVDAMAIELERITEAQRFQSKLMAGKVEEPAKLAR